MFYVNNKIKPIFLITINEYLENHFLNPRNENARITSLHFWRILYNLWKIILIIFLGESITRFINIMYKKGVIAFARSYNHLICVATITLYQLNELTYTYLKNEYALLNFLNHVYF